MDRRYVPLRPAAPGSDYDTKALDLLEPLAAKRRRVGVSVACNACRQKKIRCDGLRPRCSNCYGHNITCIYRDDDAGLSSEAKRVVVEIIGLLNNFPATEAMRVLGSLKSENNASVILSILRNATGSGNTANATDNKAETFEFEIQNPTAYPTIPPFDPQTAIEQPYSELTPFSRVNLNGAQAVPKRILSRSSRQSSFGVGKLAESGNAVLPELCDTRLKKLNIRLWTSVQITNATAARCISLYLETDHPLLGHFDPELFVPDLVSGGREYCSSLLVHALLYWACQMYGYFDPKAEELATDFCVEAERLWATERLSASDTTTNIAAAEFICLGYLGQGKDHAIHKYVSEASEMGVRLGLFGVQDDNIVQETDPSQVPDEAQRARTFAAWGTFNWLTLMVLFYRQPGLFCPRYPPRMAIPEYRTLYSAVPRAPSIEYMGSTFPHICRFWSIVHEVSVVYEDGKTQPGDYESSLVFAEFKFRELLVWSDNLPPRLTQGRDRPHHVLILHLWFHAIILDLFRPFTQVPTQQTRPLRTFSGKAVTANDVCTASVEQLKHLITEYRLHYQSSNYTILWQTALIYVVNAILNGKKDADWYADLLLCIYAYESLGRSWRVAGCISKGLLSLAMRKSELSSRAALQILADLHHGGLERISDDIRATFVADLNLALSDPKSASMEHLASQFDDIVLVKDFTTILDDERDMDPKNGNCSGQVMP